MTAKSVLIALLYLAPTLWGDGGAVLSHRETGSFAITAFASPVPLRTGVADVSVLAQDRVTLQPVLDAEVSVHLQSGESEITVQATRKQAQNKILYASSINLSAAGEWRYSIIVKRGTESASLAGVVTVARAAPKLAGYWAQLAFPPFCILVFVMHQRLKRSVS